MSRLSLMTVPMESATESVRSITEDLMRGVYTRLWLWINIVRATKLKSAGFQAIRTIVLSANEPHEFCDDHARLMYQGLVALAGIGLKQGWHCPIEALKHFEQALDAGHPNYVVCLDLIFDIKISRLDLIENPFNTLRDIASRYLQVAKAGNVDAMLRFARSQCMLWEQTQQSQTLKNAEFWAKKACQQQSAEAWGVLSVIYELLGNLDKARAAADQGALRGDLYSIEKRAQLSIFHPLNEHDIDAGVELLRQCAGLGSISAMIQLADMHLNPGLPTISLAEVLTHLCNESIITSRDESDALEAVLGSAEAQQHRDVVLKVLHGYTRRGLRIPAIEARGALVVELERLADRCARTRMYARAIYFYNLAAQNSESEEKISTLQNKLAAVVEQLEGCCVARQVPAVEDLLQLLDQPHNSDLTLLIPVQRLLSMYLSAVKGSITKLQRFQDSCIPEQCKQRIIAGSAIDNLAEHIAIVEQERVSAMRVVCLAPRLILHCPSELAARVMSFLSGDDIIHAQRTADVVSRHRPHLTSSVRRRLQQQIQVEAQLQPHAAIP